MAETRCMKANYYNCGTIKDGDDYCLFHKPEKNGEEARDFYEKLKEQATTETDENGKDKYVFNNNLNWRGYVFPKIDENRASFNSATFKGKASFEDATFECEAYFRVAIFKVGADFRRVTFKSKAFFSSATFKSEADFGHTIFKEEADFWDVAFEGGAFFGRATFEGTALFWDATFEGTAIFRDTKFEGRTYFNAATFKCRAYFRNATFKGKTYFSGSSCEKEALFVGTLFERSCTFVYRKFAGTLLFTSTEFRQGVQMEKDWENPESGKYIHPQSEKEGCRVQKLSYEKEGMKEAAEAMFVREMRARRIEKIISEKKPLFKNPGRYFYYWLEKWGIDKTCKYGTDWYSLFKATLLVIVSFSLIYFLSYFNIGFLGNLGQSSFYSFNFQWSWIIFIELCHALLQSIIFSIVTFTTLGSVIMNPEGLIINFLVGLQSLMGAFFIALFVVVFARKWMR